MYGRGEIWDFDGRKNILGGLGLQNYLGSYPLDFLKGLGYLLLHRLTHKTENIKEFLDPALLRICASESSDPHNFYHNHRWGWYYPLRSQIVQRKDPSYCYFPERLAWFYVQI